MSHTISDEILVNDSGEQHGVEFRTPFRGFGCTAQVVRWTVYILRFEATIQELSDIHRGNSTVPAVGEASAR